MTAGQFLQKVGTVNLLQLPPSTEPLSVITLFKQYPARVNLSFFSSSLLISCRLANQECCFSVND
jgi:hypothetical protein